MATPSGKVTNTLAGTTLTYTDTGTGYGTVSLRTVTIYDANGNQVGFNNMGASLTYAFPINVDGFYRFVCTVTDNNGTWTNTVSTLAEGIFALNSLAIISQVGCACNCSSKIYENLLLGELFLMSAERFLIGGAYISAQNNITAANLILAA